MITRTTRACASYLAALPSTRAVPDRDVFYVADPISSVRERVVEARRPVLFAGDDHFRPIAEAAEEFFTVLPPKPELGDVGQAESTNDISE